MYPADLDKGEPVAPPRWSIPRACAPVPRPRVTTASASRNASASGCAKTGHWRRRRRTALAERIATRGTKPVLHGDSGSTLAATAVLAMLQWLGVKPSYLRPRISDDNAYAQLLFRTAECRPEFPTKGLANRDDARTWAVDFVRRYNADHRHSAMRYVSLQQRHECKDQALLAVRHDLYGQARQRNPARWSGNTRDWSQIGVVTLNSEHDQVVAMAASVQPVRQKAA